MNTLPTRYRVIETYRDLKGRYTANVERDGVGSALGHSWSSYEAAVNDAIEYHESVFGEDGEE